MLFNFKRGWSAQTSFDNLKEVLDDESPRHGVAFEWFSRFSPVLKVGSGAFKSDIDGGYVEKR